MAKAFGVILLIIVIIALIGAYPEEMGTAIGWGLILAVLGAIGWVASKLFK